MIFKSFMQHYAESIGSKLGLQGIPLSNSISPYAYTTEDDCDASCSTWCAKFDKGKYYCCNLVDNDGDMGGTNGCCMNDSDCATGYACEFQSAKGDQDAGK